MDQSTKELQFLETLHPFTDEDLGFMTILLEHFRQTGFETEQLAALEQKKWNLHLLLAKCFLWSMHVSNNVEKEWGEPDDHITLQLSSATTYTKQWQMGHIEVFFN